MQMKGRAYFLYIWIRTHPNGHLYNYQLLTQHALTHCQIFIGISWNISKHIRYIVYNIKHIIRAIKSCVCGREKHKPPLLWVPEIFHVPPVQNTLILHKSKKKKMFTQSTVASTVEKHKCPVTKSLVVKWNTASIRCYHFVKDTHSGIKKISIGAHS